MTVAQHKIKLAQKLLQTEDAHILKAIELLFSQDEEDFHLSAAQKKELDRRLAEVENGKTKLYTMAEVKKMVREKLRK